MKKCVSSILMFMICLGIMTMNYVYADEPVNKQNENSETYIGDWNGDGIVDLNDAQDILKVALGIEEAKQAQVFRVSISNELSVTLKDAQYALSVALGIENNVNIKDMSYEQIYGAFDETDVLHQDDIYQVFSEKKDLVSWAEANHQTKLAEKAQSISEDDFKEKTAIVIGCKVYAQTEDAVSVTNIYCKEIQTGTSAYVAVTDKGEVLDGADQYYFGVLLVDDKSENIVCTIEKNVQGGELVNVQYVDWDIFMSEGVTIIRSVEELNAYKTALMNSAGSDLKSVEDDSIWTALNKNEEYFKTNTLFIYNTNYSYYNNAIEECIVTWQEKEGKIEFLLEFIYNVRRNVRDAYSLAINRMYVVDVANSLIGEKEIAFSGETQVVARDMKPEQESFYLETTSSIKEGQKQKVSTEEERDAVLKYLADKGSNQLIQTIENMELENKDYLILTDYNPYLGEEPLEMGKNPIYVLLHNDSIELYYEQGGPYFEKKVFAYILCFEKDSMGKRLDEYQDWVE